MSVANTAIIRKNPSAPLQTLIRDLGYEWILHGSILDYGCGAGRDVLALREAGCPDVWGYDPYFTGLGELPRETKDVVLCTYVLNVIKSPRMREKVISNCIRFADRAAIFSMRRDLTRGTATQVSKTSLRWFHEILEAAPEACDISVIYDTGKFCIVCAEF
jgi:hypothetical protein